MSSKAPVKRKQPAAATPKAVPAAAAPIVEKKATSAAAKKTAKAKPAPPSDSEDSEEEEEEIKPQQKKAKAAPTAKTMPVKQQDNKNVQLPPPTPVETFITTYMDQLSPELQKSIKSLGLITPNKLQSMTLPHLFKSKDMLLIAPQLLGKTLTALLPAIAMIQKLNFKQRNLTGVLVLSPSREQALLTYQVVKHLTQHITGLTYGVALSQTNDFIEFNRLQKGSGNILIATPKRANLHITTKDAMWHKNIFAVIVDDMDKHVEMGFNDAIINICSKIDPLRQTICTSTYNTREVQKLAKVIMNTKPLIVGIKDQLEVAPESAETHTKYEQQQLSREEYLAKQKKTFAAAQKANILQHGYITTLAADKMSLLYTFIKKLVSAQKNNQKIVVIVPTKEEIDFYTSIFNVYDILSLSIHEFMSEKQRTKVFFEFNNINAQASQKNHFGLLFITQLSLQSLYIPLYHTANITNNNVNYIIHLNCPVSVQQYYANLSHFVMNNNTESENPLKHDPVHAVMFLHENNEKFFIKLNNDAANGNVAPTFVEYTKPQSVINMYKDILKLQTSNFFIHTMANKAYYAYMRYYMQYKTPVEMDDEGKENIFNYDKIDIQGVAKNFGLEHPPMVKKND